MRRTRGLARTELGGGVCPPGRVRPGLGRADGERGSGRVCHAGAVRARRRLHGSGRLVESGSAARRERGVADGLAEPPGAAPRAGGAATTGAQAPVGSGAAAASIDGATAAASPTPATSPEPSASASPAASAAPPAGAAPTSAAGFKVRDTIVPMTFPLPATASYRYGDRWRAPRVGVARSYNQIRGVAQDGTYLRAHDGLDLLVKLGTPVVAPFTGRVIDPATRWKPWDPSRYGRVVVIESTEPTSPGYAVILAHLSSVAVKVGDGVERGQVVGKTGKTGNAAGTPPHLHLETRAPFRIRYGYAGVIRRLDVFDAEPSIRAADPKAR